LHIVRDPRFAVTEEDLAGADAFMSFCNPVSVMKADSSLRWFHNYFVGMDRCAGLPDEVLDRVVFSNNKRLSGPTIAEHTVAMMMSLARGLPAYSRAQAENRWDRSVADRPPFGELKGKTLFVVGLGVIALRHSSREGPDYVDYVGLSPELHELAARADVIVNALPLTSQTTGLFDQAFFAAAKPGAMFLSVGRGKSTVTDDLVEALKSGRLYGAGLDVTDPEPLPADSPLWQMPNVIITPHTSASGGDSYRRTAIIAVENLRRYIAGEPLLNVVNMRAGY
jgi:phosphoglycerate dehydrogenase-like enzyme